MNFQGVHFFHFLQFEQRSVLRPPTHLNPNVVRIIKSAPLVYNEMSHYVPSSVESVGGGITKSHYSEMGGIAKSQAVVLGGITK